MTLTDHLKQLIVERDTVILPGFGALETRYEPAAFDYVQGKLYPPNKSLTFNANLRLNDGTLIRHVQQHENCDYEAAKTRVEDFVGSIKTQLATGETIHLPGIGKFFHDLNQKTHFLPEGQAQLYPATFGLPTVNAQPVQRAAAAPAAVEAPAPTAAQHPGTLVLRPSRSARIANVFVRALPFLLVLAIGLIGYTVYKIQDTDDAPYVRNVNQERINRKPGIPTETAEIPLIDATDDDLVGTDTDTDGLDLDAPASDYDRRDTESSTLEPGRQTDVIVVGTFGTPRYAERMLQRVSEDGYDGWSERMPNGLRRIGVNIAFSSEMEKRERLETMRDRYTRSAYLLSEK